MVWFFALTDSRCAVSDREELKGNTFDEMLRMPRPMVLFLVLPPPKWEPEEC